MKPPFNLLVIAGALCAGLLAVNAADIDKSGAAGAQKATEANVKKMGDAIVALQAKLQPAEGKK